EARALGERRGDVVLARAVAIGANVGEIAWRDVEPSGGRSVATSAGAVADGAAALGVELPPAVPGFAPAAGDQRRSGHAEHADNYQHRRRVPAEHVKVAACTAV